jgi:hypothetical protein
MPPGQLDLDRRGLIEHRRDLVLSGVVAAPLRPSLSAGFALDLRVRRRQIGRVDHSHARWAADSMNRLLERLKQGLRSIGRGTSYGHDVSKASHALNDRDLDTRLRTELDDAPSSLDKRPPPSGPSPRPSTSRARMAVLSKAHRAIGTPNAPSIWGLAPTSRAAVFDGGEGPAPALPLTGSAFAPPVPPAKAEPHRSISSLLDGAIEFGSSLEPANPPSPPDTAHPFPPDDDRPDRPF